MSSTVRMRLEHLARLLRSRQVRPLTLTPLILRRSLGDLLERRARLFAKWDVESREFGCVVSFARDLRPTLYTPKGRRVEGQFDVLQGEEGVCLVACTLRSDVEAAGPGLLARRAYPLAARPFISSEELLRLVVHVARERDWTPLCADAMGYDRETRKFRRDLKHQPIADAFREMAEQARRMHQVTVSFRNDSGEERLLAALNRHGRAIVQRGDPALVADEFVCAVARRSLRRSAALSVPRARERAQQKVVQLIFPENTFSGGSAAGVLCDALRRAGGLNVTTVHLNPYLNAQVLDFLTGQALQLLVLDESRVSLIPRSSSCEAAMERVVGSILGFFGEAEVEVRHIRQRESRG